MESILSTVDRGRFQVSGAATGSTPMASIAGDFDMTASRTLAFSPFFYDTNQPYFIVMLQRWVGGGLNGRKSHMNTARSTFRPARRARKFW
jgi:hypothetical protein